MAVAQLDHNLRLEVNLCERGGSDLYFGVPFEPDEQVIVTQLVRSGSIVFDVGANMGLFSILASRAAGENGMVHAFEPATFAYQALQRNLRLNRVANVVANRVAVGERAGKVTLNVNLESGLSSLGQTGRGRVIAVEEVDCVSLDEYAEHRGIEKVDFLKVDVEGFDGHVLRGARRLIERSAELVVLCELAEKNFRPLGYSVTQVLSWMRERGFAVWQVDTELHQVVTVDGGRLADQNNYLFIRRPSAALRALRDAVAKGHLTTSARDTIEVE